MIPAKSESFPFLFALTPSLRKDALLNGIWSPYGHQWSRRCQHKRRIIGQPEQDVRALAVLKFSDDVIHKRTACSRHINHLPFDDTLSQFRFYRCDYEINFVIDSL